MKTISREELQCRLESEEALELIEVLDDEQYDAFHLPGAINVLLDDDFDACVQQAVPDRKTSVIVFCLGADCDTSSEAAKRLDELGYHRVYGYQTRKAD